MSPEYWWSRLQPSVQHWIEAHLGEVLPPDIASAVSSAGGRIRRTMFVGPGPTAYRLGGRDLRRIRALSQAC